MARGKKEFRFVGHHSEEDASGRTLEPGEFYKMTDDEIREPHNEQLILDGKLIPTDNKSEHEVDLAERREKRREEVQ